MFGVVHKLRHHEIKIFLISKSFEKNFKKALTKALRKALQRVKNQIQKDVIFNQPQFQTKNLTSWQIFKVRKGIFSPWRRIFSVRSSRMHQIFLEPFWIFKCWGCRRTSDRKKKKKENENKSFPNEGAERSETISEQTRVYLPVFDPAVACGTENCWKLH